MKKILLTLALFFTLILCVQPVNATEPVNPDATTGGDNTLVEVPETTYSVNVAFYKNGGKGNMAGITVTSNSTTAVTLPANTFKKKYYVFDSWNTMANGKGIAYANQADVRTLATAANNGQTITLYAQWKIEAPTVKSVKKMSATAIKVSFKKHKKAAGYQVEYSQTKDFANSKLISVKKKATAKEISGLTPGTKYFVRMRAYTKSGKTKVYGAWSKVKKVKTKAGKSIENTKASTSIEADVTLTGSGTGYHAKLVLCTPTSAVSFGIQHDEHAVAPYTGKTMALIENVAHNGPGGQQYTRPSNMQLKRGQTYKLMITVNKNGSGDVYVDYSKIGSFHNAGLANQAVYIRVEGAVRLNGDSVNATFDNIRVFGNGHMAAYMGEGTVENVKFSNIHYDKTAKPHPDDEHIYVEWNQTRSDGFHAVGFNKTNVKNVSFDGIELNGSGMESVFGGNGCGTVEYSRVKAGNAVLSTLEGIELEKY